MKLRIVSQMFITAELYAETGPGSRFQFRVTVGNASAAAVLSVLQLLRVLVAPESKPDATSDCLNPAA
jgi:hypothetical protein